MTVPKIFELKLSAPHVCNIACDSGRQDVGHGDETLGITSAFLYAGEDMRMVYILFELIWSLRMRSQTTLKVLQRTYFICNFAMSAIEPVHSLTTFHFTIPTSPRDSAFKRISCSSSGEAIMRKYRGVSRVCDEVGCLFALRRRLRMPSIACCWIAGPNIASKRPLRSSARSGYETGAYCVLSSLRYEHESEGSVL
jgi:hypothetical protein